MHVPEQLFSLPLLKDVKTQPLELVFRRVESLAGGLLTSQVLYTVPSDRVFCLTSWGVTYANDGLGGGMVAAWLAATINVSSIHYLDGKILGYNPTGAIVAVHSLGSTGSIWIPPGAEVALASSNNCVGNPNVFYAIAGLTFPRGAVSIG